MTERELKPPFPLEIRYIHIEPSIVHAVKEGEYYPPSLAKSEVWKKATKSPNEWGYYFSHIE
jgi:hypothetical protein